MSTFKRKKVVMLPTNEKASIVFDSGTLRLTPEKYFDWKTYRHLYVISDEEINEGDWFIVELFKINGQYSGLHIEQANKLYDCWINDGVTIRRHKDNCKKIIATTDSALGIWEVGNEIQGGIKHPLPQPSKSFIEKYIEAYNKKNPIELIDVEYEYTGVITNKKYSLTHHYIKPKVNPKDNTITIKKIKDSYSTSEVENLLRKIYFDATGKQTGIGFIPEWIEKNL